VAMPLALVSSTSSRSNSRSGRGGSDDRFIRAERKNFRVESIDLGSRACSPRSATEVTESCHVNQINAKDEASKPGLLTYML